MVFDVIAGGRGAQHESVFVGFAHQSAMVISRITTAEVGRSLIVVFVDQEIVSLTSSTPLGDAGEKAEDMAVARPRLS